MIGGHFQLWFLFYSKRMRYEGFLHQFLVLLVSVVKTDGKKIPSIFTTRTKSLALLVQDIYRARYEMETEDY